MLLLKESLEAKKALYHNKIEAAEKRASIVRDKASKLDKNPTAAKDSGSHQLTSRFARRSVEGTNLKAQLEHAHSRIQSLTLELEYASLTLGQSKPATKASSSMPNILHRREKAGLKRSFPSRRPGVWATPSCCNCSSCRPMLSRSSWRS